MEDTDDIKFCFSRILVEILIQNEIEEFELAKMLDVPTSEVMDWLYMKSMPDDIILNRIAKKFDLMTEEVLNSEAYGLRDGLEYVFGR